MRSLRKTENANISRMRICNAVRAARGRPAAPAPVALAAAVRPVRSGRLHIDILFMHVYYCRGSSSQENVIQCWKLHYDILCAVSIDARGINNFPGPRGRAAETGRARVAMIRRP